MVKYLGKKSATFAGIELATLGVSRHYSTDDIDILSEFIWNNFCKEINLPSLGYCL